ncbi:MAG: HAMP domain-containing histidine kinase [Planctomycetales bacterium]|nr:HAMP domain-containing histidine kinase [Planctomycetales bacterium]
MSSSWYRSLRWRIQVWHALILCCVVVGFGGLLYWELVRSRWNDVDDELIAAARVLEGALRAMPAGLVKQAGDDLLPEEFREWLDASRDLPRGPGGLGPAARPGPGPAARPGPGPGRRRPGPGPGRRPPPPPERFNEDFAGPEYPDTGRPPWEKALNLPGPRDESLAREDDDLYFVVWRQDRSVLRSAQLPSTSPPLATRAISLLGSDGVASEQANAHRRIYLNGPHGSLICVGRDVHGEQERLRQSATLLMLSGSVILLSGLAGGWWLSGRAIAPIASMTRTASEIDATNLDQRMDLTRVDAELEQLGTVLNHMLDRIDNAFRQQQQFTADASHELRTPLAVILSATELGLSRERDAGAYREQLEKCHRAAKRMHGLVESLMSLARLDAGVAEAPSPCDLATVVGESAELLAPLAAQSQVQLRTELEPCSLLGRHRLLAQVATNLIHNAIQYNRPGGEVVVTVRAQGAEAVLTVRDNGVGIAAADLPKLFDRFYRADVDRARTRGGSGLGLAICQRIVAAHGGSISAESELGAGARFTVRLRRDRTE